MNVLDLKFRKLMLSNPELVRRSVLTDWQCRLVRYIRNCVECAGAAKGVTARQVSATFGVSVPSASTQLKNLAELGYLKRRKGFASSGGIEYTYTPAFKR